MIKARSTARLCNEDGDISMMNWHLPSNNIGLVPSLCDPTS